MNTTRNMEKKGIQCPVVYSSNVACPYLYSLQKQWYTVSCM